MKSDYSEKEFAMIEFISLHWALIIEKSNDMGMVPPEVLNILSIECFINNLRGRAVDSLRRCMKACQVCNPYRMTKEYDDLIQL